MKKQVLFCMLGAATIATQAQTTVVGSKFTDNWSIGLNAGAVTPTTHAAFFKSMRPTVGLELGKQLTPIFGLGIEGKAGFNLTESKTSIDATNIGLLGKVNLGNLFGRYKGAPRFFEVEGVVGAGWLHYYNSNGDGQNSWTTKWGVNFNFNLGEQKAWQINIKPAIVYQMDGIDYDHNPQSYLNVNHSGIELSAGVTYKFGNSYGGHNFKKAHLYDQAQVDGLNAKVNDLREQANSKDQQLRENQEKINQLQNQLNDCRNQKPEVTTIVKSTHSMESVITFSQGKSVVERSQLPNVERIATYMKNHPNSKVIIRGYASPEGSAEINAKIASARAEVVKSQLIQKYNISASRIDASGQGVGKMFSEPDWNRVTICTLDE